MVGCLSPAMAFSAAGEEVQEEEVALAAAGRTYSSWLSVIAVIAAMSLALLVAVRHPPSLSLSQVQNL